MAIVNPLPYVIATAFWECCARPPFGSAVHDRLLGVLCTTAFRRPKQSCCYLYENPKITVKANLQAPPPNALADS